MHRPQACFLTGTDTGVGKTLVACALLREAHRQGLSTLAMKPVAAGTDAEGRNEDVELLIAASSVKADRRLVNPYCFSAPIAPHIAAAKEGRTIDLQVIHDACSRLAGMAEFLVVEGVGGFRVPLGADKDTADLAQALALPVILVVGIRLGCLNHALLTAEAIRSRGLDLAGWIGNGIDPDMPYFEANTEALATRLDAPCLGIVPWMSASEKSAVSQPSIILPACR